VTTLIDMLLGPLGGALAALVAVLGALWAAYRKGRSDEGTTRDNANLKAHKKTVERMHDADGDVPRIPDDARKWLRERGGK
jgi:hypothetical protein